MLAACQKNESVNVLANNPLSEQKITALVMPADFDFQTTQVLEVNIQAYKLNDAPLAGTRVDFFDEDPEEGGTLIASGLTNPAGILEMKLRVPRFVEQVYVRVNAYGFANQASFPANQNIAHTFGGAPVAREMKFNKSSSNGLIPISENYYYQGTYSSQGVPDYLENPGDNLSAAFLSDINASLPERKPVPIYNPQYLANSNELDVVITDYSDIWVTFVHEGAGYRNALAYYVFDTDNPPASAADIDSIIILMPNTSFSGSGGGMQSGDKVHLGVFPGGKTISWVLFQNAWNGSAVDVGKPKFYSNNDFNPEPTASDRQHTVQLADIGRQILLNSFEDIQRNSSGCDHDFNDLIFYVTANPWENVSIGGIPNVTPSTDCDNDGISDEADDFPCDPLRAVRNTYSGALAYEDLWPSQGDYDFNDLVIDYEVDHILNGENKVVEVEADWIIKAVGAGFRNGFGWQFDGMDPNTISSVSGQNLDAGLISNAANGTENGHSQAVIIAFDDVFNVIDHPGTQFINTILGQAKAAPETISNTIVFTVPKLQSSLGLPPYNPFIFTNATRGKEVHLSGKNPTALANVNQFGTSADATDVNAGFTYKTLNGLPWAIDISESFDYPIEFSPINEAYLYFSSWATSGGSVYKSWYTAEAGNRSLEKVYQ